MMSFSMVFKYLWEIFIKVFTVDAFCFPFLSIKNMYAQWTGLMYVFIDRKSTCKHFLAENDLLHSV